LNWGRLRDQCLVGLSVVAFFWVASQVVGRVLHIVVVVLLALVLAYALEPPLAWAQRVLPRALAALLIYALALSVLAAGILLIAPPTIQQSEALAVRLPGYLDQLSGYQPLAGIDLSGSLRGIAQSTLWCSGSGSWSMAGEWWTWRCVWSQKSSATKHASSRTPSARWSGHTSAASS